MADDFLGYELEEWKPASPQVGPPLPRWMGIYWPWYAPPGAEFKVNNLAKVTGTGTVVPPGY